ncbi:MAG: PQQ-like beta-propeller repeat protein [Planctomycetes bacterium]|nr:PQQ-like beta-propeller repeat protein [Planctomycetota bacterium]
MSLRHSGLLPRWSSYAAMWFLLLSVSRVFAGDWPQILGPTRDCRASDETLLDRWPSDGPSVRWAYALGSGYAGAAVVGKRAVVFHRVGSHERVEAIDVERGESLWTADFVANYSGGYNPDKGPRCVPTIHANRIYVFGASGELHSVDLDSGTKRWSVNVYEELGGDEGYFGAGSSPIVAGDKLLVNVGGRKGAGLVAFSLETGRVVWKTTDERASYSSPTSAVIGGEPHVIFITRYNVVSVNPVNGHERFRFPFGKRGPTVNAATPIVFDDHLFVSASYGVGAILAAIDFAHKLFYADYKHDEDVPVERGKFGVIASRAIAVDGNVWSNDDSLSSQYSTAAYREGYLYGTHGREDIGVADLRCLEARSGKVKWTKSGFGVAHPILVGDRILLQTAEGEVVLARATAEAYQELARAKVVSGSTRALPALSGGLLFIRSSQGSSGELKCLIVGKGAAGR